MNAWETFYGPNAAYAQELYERFLQNPASVDEATRRYFEELSPNGAAAAPPPFERPAASAGPQPVATPAAPPLDVQKVVATARLARGIREYGHLAARTNPLSIPPPGDEMLNPATHRISEADLAALPSAIVFPNSGPAAGNAAHAIKRLQEIYSGPLGFEFDHLQSLTERDWLHKKVESGDLDAPLTPEERVALLRRLTQVEAFEQYLHRLFPGQKRFSIEGNDILIPMLDELIHDAVMSGTHEVLIGMAHRGRLNVLTHVLGKPFSAIFAEFQAARVGGEISEGSPAIHYGWTGDVKYHLGAKRGARAEEPVQVTLADNPSHLEFVNPVIEGFARAAQESRNQPGAPDQDVDRALAVAIHGDAAFLGEGVVAETLNLSRLEGYQTGGTIHIIVNNQIGFTTMPDQARSTLYASDLAKGFDIPIVHVNADYPDAALAAVNLAHAYRQRFHRDFLIDLVGYRRWGHNEADEPAFTQPRLYAEIAQHPPVRQLYAAELDKEGIVTSDEAEAMLREAAERLQAEREKAIEQEAPPNEQPVTAAELARIDTKVPMEELRQMNESLLAWPEGFGPNPKLDRLLRRRRQALETPGGVDWGLAEALAFASILADGKPIRLTGQDAERGTFSHRHLVLHDVQTGQECVPLQRLPQAQASFAVYNSPLTEAATLGFEYGYSVHAPDALDLWEAQFGDFANVGQVMIDQFITAARAKWRQEPALVMLLPHGYEGMGPEHSSARLERYLQLAAEDNVRIADCTTPAQYFHLLRLQAATLSDDRRPLLVMTPKSLLRHPRASSSWQDLAEGAFHPVLRDPRGQQHPDEITRLILTSGKVAVDLAIAAEKHEKANWVAITRVELLYPFPKKALCEVIGAYPNLREVVWLQEEPANMGAWTYMEPRLTPLLPPGVLLRYIGRPEHASPAEGWPEAHAREQARIVGEAFASDAVQLPAELEASHAG